MEQTPSAQAGTKEEARKKYNRYEAWFPLPTPCLFPDPVPLNTYRENVSF